MIEQKDNQPLTPAEWLLGGIAVGLLAYVFVVPFVRGLLPRQENFGISIFDMSTTPDEDVEIIVALKEFFDNNTVTVGNDGWTEWMVE